MDLGWATFCPSLPPIWSSAPGKNCAFYLAPCCSYTESSWDVPGSLGPVLCIGLSPLDLGAPTSPSLPPRVPLSCSDANELTLRATPVSSPSLRHFLLNLHPLALSENVSATAQTQKADTTLVILRRAGFHTRN